MATILFTTFIFYILSIFIINNLYFLISCFIFQILIITLKKLNIKKVIYSFTKLLPLVIITFIFNYIFDSFFYAIWISFKLILVCNITYIYKEIFGTLQMINSISTLLSPFKILGISNNDISLIINIAITFIPNFIKEIKQVSLSLKQKNAKSYSITGIKYISKHMLVSIFKKTQSLELTLKSKAYTEN